MPETYTLPVGKHDLISCAHGPGALFTWPSRDSRKKGAYMEINRSDAITLLYGWLSENRAIQAVYTRDGVKASILGFIDSFVDGTLKISATRMKRLPVGDAYQLCFPLAGAKFEYEDEREAPPELREAIARRFESLFWIHSSGGSLVLALLDVEDKFS